MMSYIVMLNSSETTFENDLKARNSILLDAVHHARELTTISQTVFGLLTLLYKYERGDEQTLYLLEKGAVIFKPIVNVDGVALIDYYYFRLNNL